MNIKFKQSCGGFCIKTPNPIIIRAKKRKRQELCFFRFFALRPPVFPSLSPLSSPLKKSKERKESEEEELDSTREIWKRLFPPSRGSGRRSRHRSRIIIPPLLVREDMDCCRHVNPFRICTGLRVIGYFMILLVAGIVSISYYAVVVIAWGPRISHGWIFSSFSLLAALIVVVFHILLVLLIWSYTMVVCRDPGPVPDNWTPTMSEESMEAGDSIALSAHGVVASVWSPVDRGRQDVRYCNRCQNHKPPRCHHCSICQRCVLKMDHHCVWVVNCVGARNYKFFLLFLFYTFLETILDTFALLPRFVKFFGNARQSGTSVYLAITFLVFILSLAFALSLLCFLVMHSSLLLSNTTTIECSYMNCNNAENKVYEKKKSVRWKYDMGKRKNFEQVFGTNKLFWFLPMYSKEDIVNLPSLQGLDFPVQPESPDAADWQ